MEVKQAAFLLQRQSKLQSTELADVRDGLATWQQVLRQVNGPLYTGQSQCTGGIAGYWCAVALRCRVPAPLC